MPVSLIVAIVLGVAGVIFTIAGFRRLRQRNMLSALHFETFAIVLFVLAAIAALLASNMMVYQRLGYEAPVATIRFQQTAPQQFRALLQTAGRRVQSFDLRGDEWQLDVHILKWRSIANLLGLDAEYRLHRLWGRYNNIEQARNARNSIYDIAEPPEMDIWQIAGDYPQWLGWLVDAAYGSAVFLPMTDAAEYEIRITQSGLIARPVNAPARQAVSKWIGL